MGGRYGNLGVALGMAPYLDASQASIVSACAHDVCSIDPLGIHEALRDV